jgi:hypothetical protein
MLAFVGFLAATYEAMIPDVHDGDATTTVADGTGLDGHGPADSGGGSPSHSPKGDGQSTQHPVHVDHCGHNHMGSAPAAMSSLALLVVNSTSPSGRHSTLVSISGSPDFRPPIL